MRWFARARKALAASLAGLGLASAVLAGEKLSVVTSIPDLADVVRQVGGDLVEVRSIARGAENVHQVQVRPAHLVALNEADLFVQVGLSLEHAYVPGALEAARNKRIQPGAAGFVNASSGWDTLDVPQTLSRQAGVDLHPQGNPHVNLDPRAGRRFADQVLAGLIRVAPESRTSFEERHRTYLESLDAAEARWAKLADELGTHKVVCYHSEFRYLLAALRFEEVGTIEPKPGVPPSPRDLARLIEKGKAAGVELVLSARWSMGDEVREVAQALGARVVELPTMVDGTREATSWIALMDLVHDRLRAALAHGATPR